MPKDPFSILDDFNQNQNYITHDEYLDRIERVREKRRELWMEAVLSGDWDAN